jgi:2-dehydro-3-deoxyphosphooctonate aldolase (KDO 8-P synthase)
MSWNLNTIREEKSLIVIAGPCVIESEEHTIKMAKALKELAKTYELNLIFKSSFDKANRSSISSYRGPGIERGLEILQKVKDETNLKIISDVHETYQVKKAAKVLDVLQVPALLCRQTDLLLECGMSGKPINVKKGQFLSPEDMKQVAEKIMSTGNKNIMLTERGTTFGYNNLVVDFRSLIIMKNFAPVIFDCTHSVQLPGAMGTCSSGEKEYVFPLLRAALAVGVDGIFMEVHDDPQKALCDGPNMLNLDEAREAFEYIKKFQDWSRAHERNY